MMLAEWASASSHRSEVARLGGAVGALLEVDGLSTPLRLEAMRYLLVTLHADADCVRPAGVPLPPGTEAYWQEGQTALMRATECGMQAEAALLLEHGASLLLVDARGRGALHYAVQTDDVRVMRRMAAAYAQAGARVEPTALLMLAVRSGLCRAATWLIHKGTSVMQAQGAMLPIERVLKGDYAMALVLLKAGGAAMIAAMRTEHVEWVDSDAAAAGAPDGRYSFFSSLLAAALREADLPGAAALWRAGRPWVDVDGSVAMQAGGVDTTLSLSLVEYEGSPLQAAVASGQTASVLWLLNRTGGMMERHGACALADAARSGRAGMLRALLAGGVLEGQPAADKRGTYALLWAIKECKPRALLALLEAGVDPNEAVCEDDEQGHTDGEREAWWNDLNAEDWDPIEGPPNQISWHLGMTALMVLASLHDLQPGCGCYPHEPFALHGTDHAQIMLDMLLAFGADPAHQNDEDMGKTAAEYAEENDNDATAAALRRAAGDEGSEDWEEACCEDACEDCYHRREEDYWKEDVEGEGDEDEDEDDNDA